MFVVIGLASNGFRNRCSHCLMVGHYKTYITSSVGQLRSDLVGLLVLWTVAYNGRGTNILLQVPRDNANPAENG
jgi:hypothetical protein